MGAGTGGGNIVWSIVWFLILLIVAFPVAGFCAGWYILILPFTVCIDGLTVSLIFSHAKRDFYVIIILL